MIDMVVGKKVSVLVAYSKGFYTGFKRNSLGFIEVPERIISIKEQIFKVHMVFLLGEDSRYLE